MQKSNETRVVSVVLLPRSKYRQRAPSKTCPSPNDLACMGCQSSRPGSDSTYMIALLGPCEGVNGTQKCKQPILCPKAVSHMGALAGSPGLTTRLVGKA